MKNSLNKLLILTILIYTQTSISQIRFVDKEYSTASILVDPSASIKEQGINLVAELELVSRVKYVKVNTQVFTALDGGYLDLTGGVGINLTIGKFDAIRQYTGIRLGFINREIYIYPLVGLETGLDYNINNIIIKIRCTSDYRSDFKYSGAKPEMQLSTYIGIGKRF